VASGGELSRVFLALKNTLRQAAPGGTLIFDEVDAGIGGAVADRIGAVLAELSADHQVLCITHLPQVAARATAHWSVRKDAQGRAQVVRLDAPGRVDELARMAGGEEVTEATRRHARALLRAAKGEGKGS
jgi:DNA repair protein RecN (Recombination protein N)